MLPVSWGDVDGGGDDYDSSNGMILWCGFDEYSSGGSGNCGTVLGGDEDGGVNTL